MMLLRGQVAVAHGHANIGVTQELLHDLQVDPLHNKLAGE